MGPIVILSMGDARRGDLAPDRLYSPLTVAPPLKDSTFALLDGLIGRMLSYPAAFLCDSGARMRAPLPAFSPGRR